MSTKGEDRRVRWGILGCARVAESVMAPAIQRSRNGKVLAVASRSLAKARRFAKKFSIPRTYGSYKELLDDPDVQAVYIPLVNSLHREWTIRAAEKGKHILCEKPLASNGREAQEMVDTCRRHGVILMEAFAHRFQPQNLQVKELVDGGRIGDLLGMTAIHSGGMPAPGDLRLSRELGGGILMDKGCYCVNTARFIMGSEPTYVFARAEFGEKSGVDERMTVMLQFPGRKVVQFDCSFGLSADMYYQSYEVYGAKGRIYAPRGFAQVETYRRGEVVDAHFFVTDSVGTKRIDFKGVHQWQLEAEYFADRVLQGEGIGFPAEDGLANMRVIDAIYATAREGCAIVL